MEPGLIFTTLYKRIKLKSFRDTIKFRPFGDIHGDSDNCDTDRWKHFLDVCKKEDDENTLYLNMGDTNDFASQSERTALRLAKLHDDTLYGFERRANKNLRKYSKETWFMKDRMLGFIRGNHTWVHENGLCSEQILADHFKTKFLGVVSYIRLAISFGDRASKMIVDIFPTHGKGGGKLLGSKFNKVDDMKLVCPYADIYLMGHDHSKGAIPSTVLQFMYQASNDIELIPKQKRQWFGRTGSFLRGYVPESTSYVMEKLMRPADLGTICFLIKFIRKTKNQKNLKSKNDVLMLDIHNWS